MWEKVRQNDMQKSRMKYNQHPYMRHGDPLGVEGTVQPKKKAFRQQYDIMTTNVMTTYGLR